MFPETVVPDLRQVFLGDDDPGAGGRRPVERHEVRPRGIQPEAHGERIDDLDRAHASLELLGAGAFVALEAELHVLGGEGIAVVELEPAAQLELVHEPVRALRPRFGKARAHLLVRERARERVVDRVERAEGRDLGRRARRIEPGRRDRDVPGDDHLAGRRRLPDRFLDRSECEDNCREQQGDAVIAGPHIRPSAEGSVFNLLVLRRG